MSVNLLSCSRCQGPLPAEVINAQEVRCPACAAKFQVAVFRAAFRPDPRGALPQRVTGEGQATCFHHTENQAAAACTHCGRYMCSLCGIPMPEGPLCPICFQAIKDDPEDDRLRWHYSHLDRAVLLLAVLPMLFFPLPLITAPMTIALGIYAWKRSRNPLGPHRGRIVVGMLFALLELAGVAAFFFFLISQGIS